jgi:CRISPR system Cascade subunit CasE
MYLSRLVLNPRNAQVWSELAHPYEMHRTLSKGFLNGTFESERDSAGATGLLFRVDQSPRENRVVTLVQSQVLPDWSYLGSRRDSRGHPYLVPDSLINDGKPNPATTNVDLSTRIAKGRILSFRLRANPTKRLGKSATNNQGKRVGIHGEKKQLEWLSRKALSGGFRVLRVVISRGESIKDIPFGKKDAGESRQRPSIELLSVQFDGLLEIVDPQKMCLTIEKGIGSGKGFGFGLLSIARAQS